jgi:hypothetical protein
VDEVTNLLLLLKVSLASGSSLLLALALFKKGLRDKDLILCGNSAAG